MTILQQCFYYFYYRESSVDKPTKKGTQVSVLSNDDNVENDISALELPAGVSSSGKEPTSPATEATAGSQVSNTAGGMYPKCSSMHTVASSLVPRHPDLFNSRALKRSGCLGMRLVASSPYFAFFCVYWKMVGPEDKAMHNINLILLHGVL
jgi:hypothetical protein